MECKSDGVLCVDLYFRKIWWVIVVERWVVVVDYFDWISRLVFV